MKFKSLTLALPLIILGTQVFAAGDLSRNNPEQVIIEMGSTTEGMYFKPNHLEFETGKAYKIVLRNIDSIKHEIYAAEFSEKSFTRKVEIIKDKKFLAEIKGNITEIEVGPYAEVEWFVVPVQTGKNLDFVCALPGHKEAGMFGTIDIK